MKVKLVAHSPNPEMVVASAAKLCYSAVGVEEITENLTAEKTEKFIDMLMDLGHESPVEHVSFTFAIEGVSRVLTHQLVRHRVGCSYSQQSQRYVKLEQFEYIIPPQIEAIPEAKAKFIEAMEYDQKAYNELTDLLFQKHYNCLKAEGKPEKGMKSTAEKMAIEDARYVFPNACETKIMVTMTARALFNFFNLRCCNRAQWEIRQLAEQMVMEVKKIAPVLFKHVGPSCVRGNCTEGTMSCGKMQAVREKYK